MLRLKIIPNRQEITNDMSIAHVAKKYPPPSWEKVFEDAFPELDEVSEMIEERKKYVKIVPNMKDVFYCFWKTPLNKVRVVIIGQDCYQALLPNGEPQAMGLCFSIRKGCPLQPSLKIIFKELKNTVEGFNTPTHGDLTSWAEQGILLLNMALTTDANVSKAHKSIYAGFIKKVVKAIMEINPNTIWVAWGGEAQKIKKFTGERGIFLECGHPSPLNTSANKFLGCNHFNQINELLQKQGVKPINWNLD